MLPTRVPLEGWVDPADAHAAIAADGSPSFWLDSGPDAAQGWSWVGTGVPERSAARVRAVVCAGDRGAPAEGGPFSGGWVGWMGYDGGAAAAGAPAEEDGSADECWLRVDAFLAFDHAERRVWALAPTRGEAEVLAALVRAPRPARAPAAAPPRRVATARVTPERYAELIERCRDRIRAGDAYQLCLTTRFEVPGAFDPAETYERLRTAGTAHHGGMLRGRGSALLSASPERFLEVARGVVRTHPIKGTRPRGATGAEDAALAEALRADVKEQAENVMIVDLMRNDLSRVCIPASVGVDRLLEVETYPAVHQLVSSVSGTLEAGTTVGDLLTAAFPAGSMTGAPKLSAMTILHELEQAPRGVYAGCFGWVGTDGALDLAMVIRSIHVTAEGASVGAGGGITWRSRADAEVAEVGVKARAPLAALGAGLPPGW